LHRGRLTVLGAHDRENRRSREGGLVSGGEKKMATPFPLIKERGTDNKKGKKKQQKSNKSQNLTLSLIRGIPAKGILGGEDGLPTTKEVEVFKC